MSPSPSQKRRRLTPSARRHLKKLETAYAQSPQGRLRAAMEACQQRLRQVGEEALRTSNPKRLKTLAQKAGLVQDEAEHQWRALGNLKIEAANLVTMIEGRLGESVPPFTRLHEANEDETECPNCGHRTPMSAVFADRQAHALDPKTQRMQCPHCGKRFHWEPHLKVVTIHGMKTCWKCSKPYLPDKRNYHKQRICQKCKAQGISAFRLTHPDYHRVWYRTRRDRSRR